MDEYRANAGRPPFSVCPPFKKKCPYICSMKVSSKQNTLMKWFSKSPKKETPQKERRPSDEDDISDQRPNKKQKLES